MTTKQLTSENLARLYRNACVAELQALKPGNVHVFADGHGMTIHDFIKSADASSLAMTDKNLSVGERILKAVQATQNAVGMNTNLGLILLCSPLIQATLTRGVLTEQHETLQDSLDCVLGKLTVQDAQLTAQAIVIAKPAGLGGGTDSVTINYDVYQTLDITMYEMMSSAQDRDRIAWQYANSFADVMGFGISRYRQAMEKWQERLKTVNDAWATTAVYLGFLTRQLDTHVIRKHGDALAVQLMHEAREIEAEYWAIDNPKLMQKKLLAWDASLKARNINPGTSADLTVASLLASSLIDLYAY